MSTQPARGMRDFLPEDVRRRDYVVGIIRSVYDRYGFEPLETPAAENIETLLGKYGDEGNKLIFKILKRGEHEASGQADLALRYDLTVPLARVVAEYQAKLPKIFKRYQIQPVWRADRPARGRFREFYQCDIDTIGSTSPVVEAEQIAAVSEILTTLGFDDFVIRINHRKFIAGMVESDPVSRRIAMPTCWSRSTSSTRSARTVSRRSWREGLSATAADYSSICAAGSAAHRSAGMAGLACRRDVLGRDDRPALENLRQIYRLTANVAAATGSGSIRRWRAGLAYYTGAIMEINVQDLPGSLGGGGRYDNLIGMFLGTRRAGLRLLARSRAHSRRHAGTRHVSAGVEQASVDVVVAALDEERAGGRDGNGRRTAPAPEASRRSVSRTS